MPNTASITIDLTPRINDYHAYMRGDLTKQEYLRRGHQFSDIINHANAQAEWEILVQEATQHMDPTKRQGILESAAYAFFKMEFDEIVKNAIDIRLAPHKHATQPNHPTSVTLTLDIHDHGDEVTLVLSDDGPGFNETYKRNSHNKEARENSDYFSSKGSEKAHDAWHKKYTGETAKADFLLGGGGRGLKELAALVDYGNVMKGQENIQEKTYVLPQVSELVFDNVPMPDHGAKVCITTTKEPLKRLEVERADVISHASAGADTDADADAGFAQLPPHIRKRQAAKKNPIREERTRSPQSITDLATPPSFDATDTEENITSDMRDKLNTMRVNKEPNEEPSEAAEKQQSQEKQDGPETEDDSSQHRV